MARFVTDVFSEEQANVVVFSVPLGRNANEHIEALREASRFVEFFDVDSGENLLEDARIYDMGSVELDKRDLEKISETVQEIRKKKRIPLMLSPAHLSTYYALKGLDGRFKLIVFDAHTDLHDRYRNEKTVEANESGDERFNDATWLRRSLEDVPSGDIVLVGLRSITEDVMRFLEKEKITYFTSTDVKETTKEVESAIADFSKESNLYISLDMDCFDPGIAPGVSWPEPDGILFSHFKQLIRGVRGRIIGADLVCFRHLRESQVTEFLAMRSIFEILGRI